IITERYKSSPAHGSRGKIQIRRMLPTRDSEFKLGPLRRAVRSAITYLYLPVLIAWALRGSGWDVVLVHGRYAKKLLLKLFQVAGLRVVVFLSDLFTSTAQLGGCDAVICNSERVYQNAAENLSELCPIHYIPLAF